MKPAYANDGTFCPLWRRARHKVCHTCAWYVQVLGKNPQTGQDFNEWGCSIAFMPMLQIETTQSGRQTTATVDKLREEVQKANDVGIASTLMGINNQINAMNATPALPPTQPKLIEN